MQGLNRFANQCPDCHTPFVCWNCGLFGHRLSECTKERFIGDPNAPLPLELQRLSGAGAKSG